MGRNMDKCGWDEIGMIEREMATISKDADFFRLLTKNSSLIFLLDHLRRIVRIGPGTHCAIS